MPAKGKGQSLTREALLKVIPAPKTEVVHLEELGGELHVRPIGTAAWLAIVGKRAAGELGPEDSMFESRMAPFLLSACVVDAEGQPVLSAEEWERFGTAHRKAVLDLMLVVQRVSNLLADATEKKSQTPPS